MSDFEPTPNFNICNDIKKVHVIVKFTQMLRKIKNSMNDSSVDSISAGSKRLKYGEAVLLQARARTDLNDLDAQAISSSPIKARHGAVSEWQTAVC